jgi:hypothetical protein
MASSSERVDDDSDDEIDPLLTFLHVRTASVILPSGDRVRRQVSLQSIYDDNPFENSERTPLLDTRNIPTTCTGYSSVVPSPTDREVPPWERTRFDKFKTWVQSEGLKRYLRIRSELMSGSSNAHWHIGLVV